MKNKPIQVQIVKMSELYEKVLPNSAFVKTKDKFILEPIGELHGTRIMVKRKFTKRGEYLILQEGGQ